MTTTPEPTPAAATEEEDIARFLLRAPNFFERHADLLTAVRLTSPYGARAVSLQERQAEMLREKIKVLERRIMDMMRNGNDNLLLTDKLLHWTRQLFLVAQPADLPAVLVSGLMAQFNVPQAAVKVWGVSTVYAGAPFAQGVGEDVRSFAASLTAPYCGVNTGFGAVQWLDEPANAASLALVALRESAEAPAFGLLVLASPDSQRYEADMATDLLERVGDLASAALSRLRDAR
ncbi:MAG: DUF484 family protein [Burkholderiaceae bacterium]|jgi:uncharacterized protein YigA (DUF484 family)|nr:DUF484 family protein [Burkholderiaceae bacterium]